MPLSDRDGERENILDNCPVKLRYDWWADVERTETQEQPLLGFFGAATDVETLLQIIRNVNFRILKRMDNFDCRISSCEEDDDVFRFPNVNNHFFVFLYIEL